MSEIVYPSPARADLAPASKPFIERIFSGVVIGLGLTLTAGWIWLLGYGLVRLIAMAI